MDMTPYQQIAEDPVLITLNISRQIRECWQQMRLKLNSTPGKCSEQLPNGWKMYQTRESYRIAKLHSLLPRDWIPLIEMVLSSVSVHNLASSVGQLRKKEV